MSINTLKVKLLEKQGSTAIEARDQVIEDLERSNKGMDKLLTECIEVMNSEQYDKVFADMFDEVEDV